MPSSRLISVDDKREAERDHHLIPEAGAVDQQHRQQREEREAPADPPQADADEERHQRPHRHGLQAVFDQGGEALDDLADGVEGFGVVVEEIVDAVIDPSYQAESFQTWEPRWRVRTFSTFVLLTEPQ